MCSFPASPKVPRCTRPPELAEARVLVKFGGHGWLVGPCQRWQRAVSGTPAGHCRSGFVLANRPATPHNLRAFSSYPASFFFSRAIWQPARFAEMYQVQEALMNPAAGRASARPGCILHPSVWEALRNRLCLTPRERQVVQLLVEGHREADIGPLLGISPHTTHTHVGRVYRKLRVACLSELLLCVFAGYLEIAGDHRGAPTDPTSV